MAVTGVGKGFVYQNNSRRSVKNTGNRSFLGEISDAVKGAEEKQGDETPETKAGGSAPLSSEEMMQEIREKMQELYEKILKGETRQSFQIGGSSFTVKEWERLLRSFDESEKDFEEQLKEFLEMQKEAAEQSAAEKKQDEESEQEKLFKQFTGNIP